MLTSMLISRASAALLLIGGVILLFSPDAALPWLIPDYPTSAFWLGQLIGAAWLGMAALNWLSRSSVLGGIYGRPAVFANLSLYFISAIVILKAAARADAPSALWGLAAPAVVLAIAYGWLLFRGPLTKDLGERRAG